MLERLKARIQAGSSIVMLHNTGGVVQAFASLRRRCSPSCRRRRTSCSTDRARVDGVLGATFGLPRSSSQGAHERAPMLMRTSCVAVDVMRTTRRRSCRPSRAARRDGRRDAELGIVKGETLYATCWCSYITLSTTRASMRRSPTLCRSCSTSSASSRRSPGCIPRRTPRPLRSRGDGGLVPRGDVAGAADAGAAAAAGDAGSGGGDGDGDGGAAAAAAGLAGLVPGERTPFETTMTLADHRGVIGTIRTKIRPREKWSSPDGRHQIVDQIYRYRLRTDRTTRPRRRSRRATTRRSRSCRRRSAR